MKYLGCGAPAPGSDIPICHDPNLVIMSEYPFSQGIIFAPFDTIP